MLETDAIEVEGLAVLLDDEIEPAVLDLALNCGGNTYRATILLAGDEWMMNVRDGAGRSHTSGDEAFPTQSGAILAALLSALELSRTSHA